MTHVVCVQGSEPKELQALISSSQHTNSNGIEGKTLATTLNQSSGIDKEAALSSASNATEHQTNAKSENSAGVKQNDARNASAELAGTGGLLQVTSYIAGLSGWSRSSLASTHCSLTVCRERWLMDHRLIVL